MKSGVKCSRSCCICGMKWDCCSGCCHQFDFIEKDLSIWWSVWCHWKDLCIWSVWCHWNYLCIWFKQYLVGWIFAHIKKIQTSSILNSTISETDSPHIVRDKYFNSAITINDMEINIQVISDLCIWCHRNFSLLSFGDEAENDEEQVDKATEVSWRMMKNKWTKRQR